MRAGRCNLDSADSVFCDRPVGSDRMDRIHEIFVYSSTRYVYYIQGSVHFVVGCTVLVYQLKKGPLKIEISLLIIDLNFSFFLNCDFCKCVIVLCTMDEWMT